MICVNEHIIKSHVEKKSLFKKNHLYVMTLILLKIRIFKIVKKKKRLEGSSYFSCSELPD